MEHAAVCIPALCRCAGFVEIYIYQKTSLQGSARSQGLSQQDLRVSRASMIMPAEAAAPFGVRVCQVLVVAALMTPLVTLPAPRLKVCTHDPRDQSCTQYC